jgi:hypothetical protein
MSLSKRRYFARSARANCYRAPRIVAVLLAVLQCAPVFAADSPKVSVVPGTPNVWSMEQAHYLLNRLRANKDGLQTKKPSEEELNPNAINGLRLDALQSFLGVAASFDQIGGTQNKLALDSYLSSTNRRNELTALADARRAQLQAAELDVVQLTEQQDLLAGRQARATDPGEAHALADQSGALAARLKAAQSVVTVLRGQVAALNDAAGGGSGAGATPAAGTTGSGGSTGATGTSGSSASTGTTGSSGAPTGSPALTTPAAEYNTPLKDKELLRSTFTSLLNSTASSFTQPRLHASQILDNFVDMQYEIVAKQLTTLRDEVGKGQRVVFLELPTSISAGAQRKLPFASGGEDRLAQSRWKLVKLYLAYDRENSACWMDGEDINDGLQTTLGFKQGHDVDEVPKGLRPGRSKPEERKPDAVDPATRLKQLKDATDALRGLREKLVDATLAYERAARERREREGLAQQLTAILEESRVRVNGLLNTPQRAGAGQSNSRVEQLTREKDKLGTASSRLANMASPLETLTVSESAARKRMEEAQKAVDDAQAQIHKSEADLLANAPTPARRNDYYGAATRSRIMELEGPCQQAQIDFAEKERRLHETEEAWKKEKEKSTSIEEKLASGRRATAKLEEQLDEIHKRVDLDRAEVATLTTKKTEAETKIRELEARKPQPAAEIRKWKDTLQGFVDQIDARTASIDARTAEVLALQARRTQIDAGQLRLDNQKKDYEERSVSLEEQRKRLRMLEALTLRDQLELGQVKIYSEYGGVDGIHRAFEMEIRPNTLEPLSSATQSDAGIVRTIEMFPRQTALNVNSTHVLSNTTAVSFAMKYLFGLGAKVDYERIREKYDQFVQQEVFASGFGKGGTEFGWTFGPNPGTRVLNPGLRTTYAALAVPTNATGLEMKAVGCSFHHNSAGPSEFSTRRTKDWDCDEKPSVVIGLPDRDSSGSFWVDEVRYSAVSPGQRATVVLRGIFSPETNVLVNGKRLTQVVGLGKPSVSMDIGGSEDPGTGVIWGSYEYVNEHYLTLSLNIPTDYKNGRFPAITLISPSRTANINWLPMSVNGSPGVRLDDERLLVDKKPDFAVTDLTVIDVADGPASGVKHVTARLAGSRLSSLDRLWINGRDVDRRETVSDTVVLVDFDDPGTLKWNITAVSNEATAEARSAQTLSLANPVRVVISGVKVENVEYNKKAAPSKVDLIVSGTAFRPDLQFRADGATAVVSSSYVAPGQWIATVSVDGADSRMVVSLKDGEAEAVRFGPIFIPKKQAEAADTPDGPKGKTTITEIQTQKTVTEKK